VSLYLAYLFAEVWLGITYSMINKTVPSNAQGLAIAVFHLIGAFAGSIATFLLGVLGDKFHAMQNPKVYGYLMGGAVLLSYIGCCPFFIWAGRLYH
jgi:xanthosine utilization system XapX-like protein